MDCSIPGFLVLHHLLDPAQTHVHWVSDAMQHLILCGPLLFLPSICPSIRVFSNELALCIRGPKYWSFSFSISPSSEYSGLISFRMDWLDPLAVQGTLKSLQHYSSKASILPINTQDWSPLGWTDWISLQSKGLSRVFNTTVQRFLEQDLTQIRDST